MKPEQEQVLQTAHEGELIGVIGELAGERTPDLLPGLSPETDEQIRKAIDAMSVPATDNPNASFLLACDQIHQQLDRIEQRQAESDARQASMYELVSKSLGALLDLMPTADGPKPALTEQQDLRLREAAKTLQEVAKLPGQVEQLLERTKKLL